MATKPNISTTWLIVGIIALLAIVAIVVMMNKKKQPGNTTASTDNGGMSAVGGYSLGTLINSAPNLGYSGAKQGIGESNYNFIMRRSAEGWKF